MDAVDITSQVLVSYEQAVKESAVWLDRYNREREKVKELEDTIEELQETSGGSLLLRRLFNLTTRNVATVPKQFNCEKCDFVICCTVSQLEEMAYCAKCGAKIYRVIGE